jgi:predicted DNA-binding protein with PD1-like motif
VQHGHAPTGSTLFIDAARMWAFALRLKPGDDLRRTLEGFAASRQLRAAYVATCAGSLKVAAIRFADQKDATTLTGPFEIVSVTGTFSTDGPHLHISVSDAGGRTFGGHLAEGSLVYTTAEVVIVELVGASFRREIDPTTTYKELVVEWLGIHKSDPTKVEPVFLVGELDLHIKRQ